MRLMEARNRIIRAYWTIAALAQLLAAGGLFGLDSEVAGWTAGLPDNGTIWDRGTALLDLVALKNLSTFLLGFILLLAAGLLLALRRTRPIGWILLYVGSVQFLSTVAADLSKPRFGRLRPFEAAQQGADTWFVGANSFPSGHEAFYAGLFLPLMLVFPRAAPLLALPPLFVAAARVAEHDHYLSDVSVSIALAALLAIALRPLFARSEAAASG